MSQGYGIACLVAGAVALANLAFTEPPLAEVRYFGSSVEFSPKKWGDGFLLRIVAPDGSVVNKTVTDGVPSFDLSELKGPVVDGRYKYELRMIVSMQRNQGDAMRNESARKSRVKVPSLGGSFQVLGGSIVPSGGEKSDEPSVDLSLPKVGPDAPDITVSESLYVLGYVGIGTTYADWDLHIRNGKMPGIRLEQDASLGGTPGTWSIYADPRLMIRESTGANRYPFVIESGAPTNSLVMRANGNVGLGLYNPSYPVEVRRSGQNSSVVVNRSDGATNYINATTSFGNFGTVTNHPLRLVVNGAWQMRINSSSAIQMANGAYLSAGGVWTDASSRSLKQDIEGLSIEEAKSALADLEPVKFAYKSNGERHVGFIAEDVPDLMAGADRNGLSPMDVVAVLTRVLQQQQQELQEQREIINELRATAPGSESRWFPRPWCH